MPKDKDFYREAPAIDAPPPMTYTEAPPLDEDGHMIEPAGKPASGDKRGAAADSKEK
jgi:hypothetical protein